MKGFIGMMEKAKKLLLTVVCVWVFCACGAGLALAQEAEQSAVFETLSYGSQGESVTGVQQRLSELGYYAGLVTGTFLDGTQQAVEEFQQRNGLAVNGKVNAAVYSVLMAENALPKPTPAPVTPVPQPLLSGEAIYAETQGTSPTPGPMYDQQAQAQATAAVQYRTLAYGSKGDEVRALQQQLTLLGYYSREVSGNYLDNTRKAVKAFQRNNSLQVDGVAGSETQRILWDESLALDAASTPRPTATPAPLRYMLAIDLTNQITAAYELDETGEYSILVREMICSTGVGQYATPAKTVQSKGSRARWGYFPKWGTHAQYLTRIDSLNAFHSVIYSTTNEMALSVGSYEKLGSPASHGCVRLLVEDAKWIYDNCPNGTTITAFYGVADPEKTEAMKPAPLDRSKMLPSVTPAPTPEPVYDAFTPPQETRQLKKGSQGADVYWLQRKLTELGYYQGTVTGGYYGGTQDAIKQFQKDSGLSADGICGAKTWAALLGIMGEQQQGAQQGHGAAAESVTQAQVGQTPAPTAVLYTPVPGAVLATPIIINPR